MLAGQRLMEALIVYCKVPVGNPAPKKLKADDGEAQKKEGEEEDEDGDGPDVLNLADFSCADLERELTGNKELIRKTAGREDGEASSASDSEPSADNMEEEDLA